MIQIRNLSKDFGQKRLFDNVNIDIQTPGLYVINGMSGCGKTTLLNIIGLLDDSFGGEYFLNGKNVALASSKEKELMRYNLFSFIFQNPKFIENESILSNAKIYLHQKIDKLILKEKMHEFHLDKKLNTKINALSGGEEKRLNLVFALLKNTPIILADEITSGLDEKNKKEVLSLLKKISKQKIIILVTHDIELIKKYTNHIYYLSSGQLDEIKTKNTLDNVEIKDKKNHLSDNYLIKHVRNMIKLKKGRLMISSFSSIIALVCLGFCLLLTSTLKNSIISSLGNLIDENQIIIEKKNTSYLLDEKIVIEENELKQIANKYSQDIVYLGEKYLNNFNDFFVDDQTFYLNVNNHSLLMNGFCINTINEFYYIDDTIDDFIYYSHQALQEDEIIINLSSSQVYSYCQYLNIEYQNDSSLYQYLTSNYLPLTIFIENELWDYYHEIDLKVVGYNISTTPGIYHTSSDWNEYMLENEMQLIYSKNLLEDDYYPWTMKKIDFLAINEDKIDNFLESILLDENLQDYKFFIFNHHDDYGIYFVYNHSLDFRLCELETLLEDNQFFQSYTPYSSSGYSIVKDALMKGFYYPTYISSNYGLMEEFIEYNNYSDQDLSLYQSSILSYQNDNLLSLNLIESLNTGSIKINTYQDEVPLMKGKYATSSNKIIVSKGLYERIYGTNYDDYGYKQLYFLTLSSIDEANGKYINNFSLIKLNISGIIDDDEEYLFVNYLWPITFMMKNLFKGQDEISIDAASFAYDGEDIASDIEFLNEKYPDYSFSNPFIEYKDNINQTIKYVEIGLNIFSFFSLATSLMMVIMASYLFVVDFKKEIGIYTYLGYSKKSIKKQFKMISFYLSFYAGILSCISLIFIIYLTKYLNLGFEIVLDSSIKTPFLVILGISFIIGVISSYFSCFKTFKISPLKQLQDF